MPRDRKAPLLSDAEEARIQAAIATDADNPELTASELGAMRPAAEVLPSRLYDALTLHYATAGSKVPVELHVDRKAVDAFKATGEGWQARMNAALVAAARKL